MLKILQLPYLGNRTYLQGTTLFQAIHEHYSDANNIQFCIRNKILSDRVNIHKPNGLGAATFSCLHNFHTVDLEITPIQPSNNPIRLAFNEAAITDLARIDVPQQRLTYPGAEGVNFIQALVALNKKLLNTLLNPQGSGQWLFVKLESPYIPIKQCPCSMQINTILGDNKLVKTTYTTTAHEAGVIYFSWYELPSKANTLL